MPWSDDTRCLFCDGKLPLYRKLTQGQFCSKQHQKLYWEEQERLAVERLHQTHNELYAYRPPEPIESILGPELVPEITTVDSPSFATLIPDSVAARLATVPDFVAADPFEYEMVVRPFAPQPGTRVIETRNLVRVLPNAGPASLTFRTEARRLSLPTPAATPDPLGIDIAPVASFTLSATPRRDLAFQLGMPGRLRLPFIAEASHALRLQGDAQPLTIDAAPVRAVALNLEPSHAALEHVLLDQLPLLEKLLRLGYLIAIAGGTYLPLHRVPAKRFALKRTADLPLSSGLQGIFGEYAPVSAGLRALAAQLGTIEPAARRSEALPCEIRPLAPLSVSLNAPPATAAYEPGTPGLVQLHTVMQPPAAPARPASAGPADAPMPSYALPVYLRRPAPARTIRHRAANVFPLRYRDTLAPTAGALRARTSGPMLVQPLTSDPLLPEHRAEPMRDPQYSDAIAAATRASMPWVRLQAMVGHGVDFWRNAPRDLKLLAFAIPALLALVFAPSLPKISVGMPQLSASFPVQIRQVVNAQVEGFKQSMANRAGIALDEDFRSGLDEWISKGGATTQWSFDATGFVRPGPLALYAPSMNLTDYQMQFMGILDNKAMSWVVRAKDFQNYYVVKLTVAKAGPVPTLRLTRYAVIEGKAQDRVDTRVPLVDARNDTNYRIRMDIAGDDFSVMIQEQMIDSWTEPRLNRGGIGFYTADGEKSRIRWVQVTHQYDMLGRLCAYLAPVNFPTTTGSW